MAYPNLRSDPKSQLHARNAFRISVVLLAATLLLLPMYAYLSFQTGAWQYLAEFILLAVHSCLVFVGAWLSRHGRSNVGSKLILGSVLVTGLGGSFLFYGLGLMVGLGLVLILIFIASQTLAPREAGWAFLAGLTAGAVTLLLDLYGPPGRLPSPEGLEVCLPAMTAGLVLVLAFLMARQITTYPLRIKLMAAFLMVGLIPFGVLGFLDNRTAQAALTANTNEALLTAASQTASTVDTFIQTNLKDIEVNAKFSDWPAYLALPEHQRSGNEVEVDIQALFRAFSSKDQINILSYALLDRQGRNVIDLFPPGIGADESQRTYFQVPVQTHQPYVSPVEFSPTGVALLCFSSPVPNSAGELMGVLRVCYRAEVLQTLIAQSADRAGEKSFALLVDENHLLLAHGFNPDLIFKTLTPLTPDRVAQLQADRRLPQRSVDKLSTNLAALEQGLTTLPAQRVFTAETEDPTESLAVGTEAGGNSSDLEQVAVVPLKTRPWFIAFSQSQALFLKPISEQTRNALLISLLFVGLIVATAISTGYLLSAPITRLTTVAERITTGDLKVQAPVEAEDEIGWLGKALNTMTAQLRHTLDGLEQRVAERTQALERSHTDLQQAYEAIQEKHEKLLASEKMASLGRLTAGIAHEINNPLAAARSALIEVEKLVAEYQASIGADEVTPDDHQEIAREMQQAVQLTKNALERATGFVRGIKAQARDPLAPERVRFNAVPVIRESLLLVSHALRKANCTVHFESATDPLELYGSPGELAQVVTNLVTNAIDASVEKGGGPITLQLAPKNGGVEFTVSDQGAGIPLEVLPKIFDFLFTTKPVGQGTGLGLSIVHNIVTSGFGGTVSVQSEPGRGATFTLQLPSPPASG